MLGVIGGAGAALWWDGQSLSDATAPSQAAAAGTDVRLVLSGVAPPTQPNGRDGTRGTDPLLVDGILLHGRGDGAATVEKISRSGRSLAVRAPALPVELSVNHSFERIRLKITARDCGLAAEWTPSAQPFTVTWQDDHGDIHMDAGGDHDAAVELALLRYFDVVCGNQATR